VPKVSVVIPTLNRAGRLEKTIDLIEQQTVSSTEYEVLVIDNNSRDRTAAVLAAKAAVYPNLKVFSQLKRGAAATRNVGIRQATGDIVLFIDDDIHAEPNLIEAHLEYHRQNPGSAIIGSVVSPWDNSTDPFLRYLRDHKIFNPYTIATGSLDFSNYHTGNVSTERWRLIESRGFNEEFQLYGMEDIELGYRLERAGCRMVAGPGAQGLHLYFPTYEYFIDRCHQAGYSLGKMIELHPELRGRFTDHSTAARLLKRIHVCYRAFAITVEPLRRWVSQWEERRGTGAVNSLLDKHYQWAVRYHFFLGYNDYVRGAAGRNADPITGLRRQRIPGLAMERNE
jgi:glycosyltransferase involved in cell wall biosynthesis